MRPSSASPNFADNIGAHLKAGLIDWLTGSLQGVYIPKALTLLELGKFALSVLGITWAQIRGKIVKALGPSGEKIMQGLELAFDIVVALVTGGRRGLGADQGEARPTSRTRSSAGSSTSSSTRS